MKIIVLLCSQDSDLGMSVKQLHKKVLKHFHTLLKPTKLNAANITQNT